MNPNKPNPAPSDKKIQKKFYLTEKAAWYLSMMKTQSGQTYGEVIERLITEEYDRNHK